MDKLFTRIASDALSVLPEKSILFLDQFRRAYYSRLKMEGVSSEMPSILKSFEKWLYAHFGMKQSAQNVFHVIRSYSNGEEDAFDRFFALLAEFEKEGTDCRGSFEEPDRAIAKLDLVPLIREIRKNPVLYIGYPHFSGFHAHLYGHIYAGGDAHLPKTAEEDCFGEFEKWVETAKNRSVQPRPWFNIVSFNSLGDCGHSDSSAYAVFLKWLDEFADVTSKAGLFLPKVPYTP